MSIQGYPGEGDQRQRGQYAQPNGYQRLENSATIPASRFPAISTTPYHYQLPLTPTQLQSPPHSLDHHSQAHEQSQRHAKTYNSSRQTAPRDIRLTTANHQINGPITMPGGYFSGRTIRIELVEVQKADVGRKCADPPRPRHSQTHGGPNHAPPRSSPTSSGSAPMGMGNSTAGASSEQSAGGSTLDKSRVGKDRVGKKDRRPLDPPPVVEMNVYEVFDLETENQREVPVLALEVKKAKFHCCAFLHYLPPDRAVDAGTNIGPTYPGAVSGVSRDLANAADATQIHRYGDPYTASSSSVPIAKPGAQLNSNTMYDSSYPQQQPQQQSDDARHSNTQPAQHALFGTTIASAAFVPDLNNAAHTYFVFHDLSVKLEGKFALEYKVFDLLEPVFLPPSPTTPSSVTGTEGAHSPSVRSTVSSGSTTIPGSSSSATLLRTPPPASQPVIQAFSPILSTCTGGSFIVYSTKEFPGLKASTPLTRHFSRWGMRVAMRDTERKRRRGAAGPKSDEAGGEVDEGGGGGKSVPGRREKVEAKRRRVRVRGATNSHRWTEDDSALYDEEEDDHDHDIETESENDA